MRKLVPTMPHLHPNGRLPRVPIYRANSTGLPRWGTGPILLSVAAWEGLSQVLTCYRWWGARGGVFPSPQGSCALLSHSQALGLAHSCLWEQGQPYFAAQVKYRILSLPQKLFPRHLPRKNLFSSNSKPITNCHHPESFELASKLHRNQIRQIAHLCIWLFTPTVMCWNVSSSC